MYELQPDNAIPIISWFDDGRDRELEKLAPLLEELADVREVRDEIPRVKVGDIVTRYSLGGRVKSPEHVR